MRRISQIKTLTCRLAGGRLIWDLNLTARPIIWCINAEFLTGSRIWNCSVASNEIKVVLSGEGGDELFGGYGRYRKAIRPWWQGGARPMRNHSALLRANLLRHPPLNWREGILKANSQAENRERSSLQVAQANDCSNWLPNDLLIKLDRCLMAHGIEGRTPFLDPFVAELAFRLPDKLKIHGRLGKWLLRNWLSRQLPESRAFERKRGFSVPIGEWINGRAQILGPLVAAQPGVEELCERNRVCEIFKRQTAISWSSSWILLFYALWHNYHILGKPIGADIAESLS